MLLTFCCTKLTGYSFFSIQKPPSLIQIAGLTSMINFRQLNSRNRKNSWMNGTFLFAESNQTFLSQFLVGPLPTNFSWSFEKLIFKLFEAKVLNFETIFKDRTLRIVNYNLLVKEWHTRKNWHETKSLLLLRARWSQKTGETYWIKKSSTNKKVAILTGSLVTYHDTKKIPFWCGKHEMEKSLVFQLKKRTHAFKRRIKLRVKWVRFLVKKWAMLCCLEACWLEACWLEVCWLEACWLEACVLQASWLASSLLSCIKLPGLL